MKNAFAFVLVFLLALLTWQLLNDPVQFAVDLNGEGIEGPLDAVFGLAFGGLGLVIAFVVMLAVAAVLGVVFAGVGVVLVAALVLASVVLLAALSPLLLPLLIPVGIIWLLTRRSRRQPN